MAKKKRKRKKKRAMEKFLHSDSSNPVSFSASDGTADDPAFSITGSSGNFPGVKITDSPRTRGSKKLSTAVKLIGLISDVVLSRIAALILRALVEKVSVIKKHSYLKKLQSFLVKLTKDIAENRTKRFLG